MIDRERLDDWCEKGILALVLGILVFGPLAMGAVDARPLAVIAAMTVGVMVLWGIRLWVVRRPQFLWPPVCWAVVVFVGYAVARYWRADLEYVARQELMRILLYTFLFLAVINNLHRQEAMNLIGMTMVFLAMAIAMYACWQFATKSTQVWIWNKNGVYPGRGTGTFIYPNSTAAFLEILLPLALSYVIIGRWSHPAKILLGYAAVAMLAGIAVTLSRGGWLVTALTLLVFCAALVAQRDYWMQGLALAIVLAAAGMLVASKGEALLARLQNPGDKPDDMRLSVWQTGFEMWEDHLWWGVGPGHFNYRFRQYRPENLQQQPVRVHDEYLNVLTDWGITGGVLVAAVWATLWWGVFRAWKSVRGARDDFARKKSNKFAFLTGAATGLLAILLHSVVDFNLNIPAIAILVVTLMALLSSQLRFATERYWFRARTFSKCLATLVLLAGCCCLTWNACRAAREDYWLRRVTREKESSSAYLEDLKKAFAIEPMNFNTTYEIGEWYRNHSFLNMGGDPDTLALEAMKWYRRGMKLDPYDGYNWLRYGMCLDWIAGDGASSEDPAPYYWRADGLDPNGYFMNANMGWHYAQIGDNAAARVWFERSLRLGWESNDIATSYLPIVEQRLAEAAAKQKP